MRILKRVPDLAFQPVISDGWELNWKLVFGNRNWPARIAVDDRNRSSPVTLTTY